MIYSTKISTLEVNCIQTYCAGTMNNILFHNFELCINIWHLHKGVKVYDTCVIFIGAEKLFIAKAKSWIIWINYTFISYSISINFRILFQMIDIKLNSGIVFNGWIQGLWFLWSSSWRSWCELVCPGQFKTDAVIIE